jgi:hypothetical protein
MNEPTKPGKGRATAAALIPIGTFLVGTALGLALIDQDPQRLIRGMGVWFHAIAAAALVAVALCAVLAFLAVRGRRIPLAAVLAAACLPWACGVAGCAWGLRAAEEAIAFSSGGQMQREMIAMGLSEAAAPRLLGALVSGSLLAGTAIGLALGAGGLAGRGRRRGRALVALALAAPVLGLAAYGVIVGRMSGGEGLAAMTTLSAIVLGIACALGAKATSGDAGDARGADLGAGAAWTAVLGFAAIVGFATAAAVNHSMSAIGMASPPERMAVIAMGAGQVDALRPASCFGTLLALVPLAFVVLFAARRPPLGAGRIARSIAAAVVGLLAVGASLCADAGATRHLDKGPTSPWDGVAGFSPMALPERFSECCATPRAVVAVDRIVPRDGAPFALGDLDDRASRERLAAQLELLVGSAGEPRQDVDPATVVEREPSIGLAVDSRLPIQAFRGLIDAATIAGVRTLELHGMPQEGVELQRGAASFGPPFSLFVRPEPNHVRVLLANALPAGCARAEAARYTGVVADGEQLVVVPRPGADGAQVVLRMDEDRRPGDPTDRGIVCLALGSGATALTAARTAALAHGRGYEPLFLLEPTPAPPPPLPLAPPQPTGGVGAAEPGAAAVPGVPVKVKIEKPRVSGGLSQKVFLAAAAHHGDEVAACYRRGLARNPALSGRVSIKMIVSATGEVPTSAVEDSTLRDMEVENCIASAARLWVFPEPEGGGIVIATLPVSLSGYAPPGQENDAGSIAGGSPGARKRSP